MLWYLDRRKNQLSAHPASAKSGANWFVSVMRAVPMSVGVATSVRINLPLFASLWRSFSTFWSSRGLRAPE